MVTFIYLFVYFYFGLVWFVETIYLNYVAATSRSPPNSIHFWTCRIPCHFYAMSPIQVKHCVDLVKVHMRSLFLIGHMYLSATCMSQLVIKNKHGKKTYMYYDEIGLKYANVDWLVFLVLHLVLSRFMSSTFCCNLATLLWNIDENQIAKQTSPSLVMIVSLLIFLTKYVSPPYCVHYWVWGGSISWFEDVSLRWLFFDLHMSTHQSRKLTKWHPHTLSALNTYIILDSIVNMMGGVHAIMQRERQSSWWSSSSFASWLQSWILKW